MVAGQPQVSHGIDGNFRVRPFFAILKLCMCMVFV